MKNIKWILLFVVAFITIRIVMIQNDPGISKLQAESKPDDYPVIVMNLPDYDAVAKFSCIAPGKSEGFELKVYNNDGTPYTKMKMKLYMNFTFPGSKHPPVDSWNEVAIPKDIKTKLPLVDSMLLATVDMKDFFTNQIDKVNFAVAPNLKAASEGTYIPVDSREFLESAERHLKDNICSTQYKR